MFTPLHIYTSYSFLQSGFTVDHLIEALKEKNYQAAAITDLNVLFGIPEFFDRANKNSLDAIAGLDLVVEGELITLLALDETGYRQLVRLSSQASTGTLTTDFIKAHQGGLQAIVSSRQGEMLELFISNQAAIAPKMAKLDAIFPHILIGIEIYTSNDEDFATFMREIADKFNYQTIAFPFIKYHKPSDAIVLKITHAIAHDEVIEERELSGPYYLYDSEQIDGRYTDEEIALTGTIATKINFDFHQKRGSLLEFPKQAGASAALMLREMAIVGLQTRDIDFTNIEYLERLDYELRMIEEMGYSDYFLIVSDYVNHAKNHGIPVGPGRGSAPGSLVGYALGITDVDPIKYQLLFERFLNPSRKTMPDIDIDFADIRREEVIDYLRLKYGEHRVANIITFQTIQAKQAIRDIGRVYKFSPRTIEAMAKSLPDSRYDLRTAFKRVPAFKKVVLEDKECLEIVKLATKIEGLIRQSGMHPAGVVLNNEDIRESLPVLENNGHLITQYEMDYLETQGFLKMDILGLRNLTIIDNCLRLVKDNHGLDLRIDKIPYHDPKIFDLIRSGLTMGIFQLESDGMRRAIKEIKPTTFDDIVVILAIFRPGPMDNITSYAARKAGTENYSTLDTQIADILSPTFGIIIYQEQIMQIAERMAGFTLSEADLFRRAVSKKDAEKLGELQDKFVAGAIRKGYKEGHAVSVFNHIYKFADYGFNKSHSVAYAVIACQMAYLKVYYPHEFYAAILATSSAINDTKFSAYIEELQQLKITISNPDINRSGRSFTVFGKKLLFPLNAIRGISSDLAQRIVEEREEGQFQSFYDFITRMYYHKLSAKQLEHLIDAGAFDGLHKSRATLRASINYGLQHAAIHATMTSEETPSLIAGDHIPSAKLVNAKDDMIENVDRELEALGIVLSASPFKHKKSLLRDYSLLPINKAKDTKATVTVGGIVRSKKTIKTKAGAPMAFMTIYDDAGEMEVVIFPRPYAEVATVLEKNKLVVVIGHYETEKGNNFIADKVTIIEENRE
jgi:DNA polymerase-3 subunit alpha